MRSPGRSHDPRPTIHERISLVCVSQPREAPKGGCVDLHQSHPRRRGWPGGGSSAGPPLRRGRSRRSRELRMTMTRRCHLVRPSPDGPGWCAPWPGQVGGGTRGDGAEGVGTVQMLQDCPVSGLVRSTRDAPEAPHDMSVVRVYVGMYVQYVQKGPHVAVCMSAEHEVGRQSCHIRGPGCPSDVMRVSARQGKAEGTEASREAGT